MGFDLLLSRLIALLDREVAEHVKQSQQYFVLLAKFTSLVEYRDFLLFISQK